MDSNQRLILTVVLSVGIILAFQALLPSKEPPPPETPVTQGPAKPSAEAPSPAPAGAVPSAPLPAPGAPAAPAGPEQRVSLTTDQMALTFSTRDGALLEAKLTGARNHKQGSSEPVDLAENLAGSPERLFAVRMGGGLPAPGPCQLGAHDAGSVSFVCEGPGLVLTKRYDVQGPNRLHLGLSVANKGQVPLEGALALVAPAVVDPSSQHRAGCSLTSCSMLSTPAQPTYVVCRHNDSVTRVLYDADKRTQAMEGNSHFAGIDERYFEAVAVPLQPSTCELDTPSPELSQAVIASALSVPPGGTAQAAFALVIGPKDTEFLAAEGAAIAAGNKVDDPKLESAVDLGFFGAIAKILLGLLRVFHRLVPNWGVAIVLLTLFVKVLTFPLAWKSMKSMEEVRRLAPEMEAIKKKYPDDREKQQLETMQLYQKHKVNPLGGCLPMLIQTPIWLALYTVLQTSVELYNQPFIPGWINNLTARDPYYALPLMMGVTMFITQRMQPTQMDPAQQKMMLYFMPIFFTLIMLQLPSGLTLYIFTNNLLSIAQQLLLRRTMGVPVTGAASAASSAVVDVSSSRQQKKDKKKKDEKKAEKEKE